MVLWCFECSISCLPLHLMFWLKFLEPIENQISSSHSTLIFHGFNPYSCNILNYSLIKMNLDFFWHIIVCFQWPPEINLLMTWISISCTTSMSWISSLWGGAWVGMEIESLRGSTRWSSKAMGPLDRGLTSVKWWTSTSI